MAAAGLADQLEQQCGSNRMRGRGHLRPGETTAADQCVEIELGQQRQQQEQTAGMGRERPVIEDEGPRIRDLRWRGFDRDWLQLATYRNTMS